MIKLNKLALTLSLILLAACSTTEKKPTATSNVADIKNVISRHPEISTELYFSRCMSRYKNKNYINLEAKCSCEADLFPRKDINFKQKHSLCKKYNVKEGNQIVPNEMLCGVNTELKEFKSGDYIQRYRWYTQDGWVNGVYKKHAANLWRVVSVNSDGVKLELVNGEYYGRNVGDTVNHRNSPLYNKDFSNPPQYDQVIQSFQLCVSPEL
ncbi:hypothetical protein A7985_04150 [Pseudoalteromonas luteoviolacea]|uniref:Lipoprotein n=1 Tax=Pseudoalteromonas luteoviolacea TaxID=43657 RepID=A0A1C0TUZ7_9GAMM|nr:hypothetical protein [Pseudoalteromonas luteoviolacea]OCQ23150.1 hypothetical protein A7985_04150 [Pseudoalteromonas luteoviolacea]